MWSFWGGDLRHIWPKPMVLGPEPRVWARCGHFWVLKERFAPQLAQTHGSGPKTIGLRLRV